MSKPKVSKDKIGQDLQVDDLVVYHNPVARGIVVRRVTSISKSGKTIETQGIENHHVMDYQIRVVNCIVVTDQINLAMERFPENFI